MAMAPKQVANESFSPQSEKLPSAMFTAHGHSQDLFSCKAPLSASCLESRVAGSPVLAAACIARNRYITRVIYLGGVAAAWVQMQRWDISKWFFQRSTRRNSSWRRPHQHCNHSPDSTRAYSSLRLITMRCHVYIHPLISTAEKSLSTRYRLHNIGRPEGVKQFRPIHKETCAHHGKRCRADAHVASALLHPQRW